MKTKLQQLIAQGKTKQAIQQLLRITKRNDDLHDTALNISARYRQLVRDQHAGILSSEESQIELNKVNAAILALVKDLPDGISLASPKSWNWQRVAFVLGLIAAIATITGYTLKDSIWPTSNQDSSEPRSLVVEDSLQTPEAATLDTTKQKPGPNAGNNVSIEIKDQAKVGNIITGDSNKIEIKQDF